MCGSQKDFVSFIAGRTLGGPEQFWQVCDPNHAMRPNDLLAEAGRTLRVPVPQFR